MVLSATTLAHAQPILVEEPSPEECLQLLAGLAPRYEAFHRVRLSQAALAAAVAAAQRCGGTPAGGKDPGV